MSKAPPPPPPFKRARTGDGGSAVVSVGQSTRITSTPTENTRVAPTSARQLPAEVHPATTYRLSTLWRLTDDIKAEFRANGIEISTGSRHINSNCAFASVDTTNSDSVSSENFKAVGLTLRRLS